MNVLPWAAAHMLQLRIYNIWECILLDSCHVQLDPNHLYFSGSFTCDSVSMSRILSSLCGQFNISTQRSQSHASFPCFTEILKFLSFFLLRISLGKINTSNKWKNLPSSERRVQHWCDLNHSPSIQAIP